MEFPVFLYNSSADEHYISGHAEYPIKISSQEEFDRLPAGWDPDPVKAAAFALLSFEERAALLTDARLTAEVEAERIAAETQAAKDDAEYAQKQAAKDDAELQAKIAAEVEADIVARMAAHQEQESGKPTDEDKPR